jgi:exopolyphosphatase/guanosine-5'-triphosphate,3'-diphosphate pyrophosphatase
MAQSSRPSLTAVIDAGTNTFRLLIGFAQDGRVIRVFNKRAPTRLGKHLIKTSRISNDSAENSLNALLDFKRICDEFGVKKIIALGTSALREAENGAEFTETAKNKTGIDIKIISGFEEAELTIAGIVSSFKRHKTEFSILDIGGGSTEFIFNNQKISIPLGALKLSEGFIESHAMNEYASATIKKALVSFEGDFKRSELIATGGSATTIAGFELNLANYDGDKVHGHKLSLESLKAIKEELAGMDFIERSSLPLIGAEKADIIIPGAEILIAFMECLGKREVTISDYGLLEGALLNFASKK